MRKLPFTHLFMVLLLIAFTETACQKDRPAAINKSADTYDGLLTHHWMNTFRTLTKRCAGFTPPVAARAFGYAGLTLYETVVYGMPNNQSIQNQLSTGLKINPPDTTLEYNWAVAANAAMAETARLYYANMPESQAIAVAQLEEATYNNIREAGGLGGATLVRSKQWGVYVAQTIFEWSKTDGGHVGYTKNFPKDYVIPIGVGKWIPTFPKYLSPMQPNWGNNRTFVPNITSITQPLAPIAYSEDTASTFYKEAKIVYEAVKNGTAEQKIIAKYWSDDPGEPGTPPGHSMSIATIVLQKEGASLEKSAEIYAKVGMGVSDAFVSCWKTKFVYNYMRPISYIRMKFDPNFASLLETPPFPEYPSGHSVQSGAAAKILSDAFGPAYLFIDKTHASRTDIDGTPRAYRSFYDFSGEAAISRLYGGIHYREGIESGISQGTKVGVAIGKLSFKK
jgi:hypothetical protein